MQAYSAGEVDGVYLVYAHFVNTVLQRPEVFKLLPVEPAVGREHIGAPVAPPRERRRERRGWRAE